MMRIGQSIDIHQLVEGRLLILGGVEIPYEKGLFGSLVLLLFFLFLCSFLLLMIINKIQIQS